MAKKKKFKEEISTKAIDVEALEEEIAMEEAAEAVIEEKPKKKSEKGKKLTLKTSVNVLTLNGGMRLILAGNVLESGVDVSEDIFKRLAEKHS